MDLVLLVDSWLRVAAALPATLILALSALVLGFGVGLGLVVMGATRGPVLRSFTHGYIYVFRGTPLLVQLFLIYYGSGQFPEALKAMNLWVFFKEPWFCAILALTLNTAAYTAEIIRGGLLSVPDGQVEAARALGMSRPQVLRDIVLPQALRQALPAYGNEIILMVKATSLASTVTIMEMTGIAKIIIAETWSPVEVFVAAGSLYLAINIALGHGVRVLERRYPAAGGVTAIEAAGR